jgi:hypothetical protein
VNPTRSAATPAGSITAIRAELFAIIEITYGCFQPVAPTHPWDFPMPPKNGSRVPLRSERFRLVALPAAKTDSGSNPETLPAAIQSNRLTSAPIRSGNRCERTKSKNRGTHRRIAARHSLPIPRKRCYLLSPAKH